MEFEDEDDHIPEFGGPSTSKSPPVSSDQSQNLTTQNFEKSSNMAKLLKNMEVTRENGVDVISLPVTTTYTTPTSVTITPSCDTVTPTSDTVTTASDTVTTTPSDTVTTPATSHISKKINVSTHAQGARKSKKMQAKITREINKSISQNKKIVKLHFWQF